VPNFYIDDQGDYAECVRKIPISGDESARDVLLLSIEKWQTIVNYLRKNRKTFSLRDGGQRTCACCIKYLNIFECVGCPIYAHTNRTFCESTPYEKYSDTDSLTNNKNLRNATSELNFLKEILKKMDKKEAENV